MSKRGKTLQSTTRAIIYNVIKFCQSEKIEEKPIIALNKLTERVAAMTGINKDTVIKIKKEGATNNGVWSTPVRIRKGRPKKIILNDETKCAIRNHIRDFYTVKKDIPSLRKLHRVLKEDINFNGGISSLRRVLKEIGYEYKKCASKQKLLMERDNMHLSETGKIVAVNSDPLHPLHEVFILKQPDTGPGVS